MNNMRSFSSIFNRSYRHNSQCVSSSNFLSRMYSAPYGRGGRCRVAGNALAWSQFGFFNYCLYQLVSEGNSFIGGLDALQNIEEGSDEEATTSDVLPLHLTNNILLRDFAVHCAFIAQR